MIRLCPRVRLRAQPVLDRQPIIKCSFKFLIQFNSGAAQLLPIKIELWDSSSYRKQTSLSFYVIVVDIAGTAKKMLPVFCDTTLLS